MIDLAPAISRLVQEIRGLEGQVYSLDRLRPDRDAPASAGGQVKGAVSRLVVGWCVLQEAIDRQGPGVLGLEPRRYAQALGPDIAATWNRLHNHAPLLLALELRDRINWLSGKLTEMESIMPLRQICSLQALDSHNAVGAARAFCDFWMLMSDTRQLLDWAEARSLDPLAQIPADRCPGKDMIRNLPTGDFEAAFDRLIQMPKASVRLPAKKLPHKHHFRDFGLAALLPELYLEAPAASSSVLRVRELFEWAVNYWAIHINPDQDYGMPGENLGDENHWAWEEAQELLDFQPLWQVLDSPAFRPETTVANQRALPPLLTADKLARQVDARLREAYLAFAHESYLGALLLCRSALEYALVDRADALGIEITYGPGTSQQGRTQTLKHLIEQTVENHDALEDDLNLIQRHGNRIAHPKLPDTSGPSEPDITRGMALQSIEATFRVLSNIYGRVNR